MFLRPHSTVALFHRQCLLHPQPSILHPFRPSHRHWPCCVTRTASRAFFDPQPSLIFFVVAVVIFVLSPSCGLGHFDSTRPSPLPPPPLPLPRRRPRQGRTADHLEATAFGGSGAAVRWPAGLLPSSVPPNPTSRRRWRPTIQVRADAVAQPIYGATVQPLRGRLISCLHSPAPRLATTSPKAAPAIGDPSAVPCQRSSFLDFPKY